MLGRQSGVRLRALRADYNSAALAAILGALAVVALLVSAALVPVGPLIGLLIGSGRSTVAGIVFFTTITLVAFTVAART